MKRIISFTFALVFSLFFSFSSCLADEVGSHLNNNLSKELKDSSFKKNNNEKIDIPKASNEDIFGDEQAFPFIAGLGKNAAH